MNDRAVAASESRIARRIRLRYVVLIVLALCLVGVVIWYRSGAPQATLAVGEDAHAVAFSPDGITLATGGSRYDGGCQQVEGTIGLWDLATHRQVAAWVAHSQFITYLAFDRGGRTLTSAAIVRSDGPSVWEVKVWDVATQKEVENKRVATAPGGFPIISPSGRVVAKQGGGGVLVLCDTGTGDELYRVQADQRQLNCAAFSPDGDLVATGGGDTTGSGPSPIPWANGSVRLWEVSTGRLVATFNRHIEPIESVTFSLDGKLVASASLDGTVKVWAVLKR